jgi:CheY-like chemotaxis protein
MSRVLIVEDNRDSARTLAILLELWGYSVALAYDGLSAIEVARGCHPDTILLDIGLPGIDGYEVARRLRRESGPRTPVLVALTAYGREEDRRRAFASGFNYHLVKPADLDALRSLLESSAAAS